MRGVAGAGTAVSPLVRDVVRLQRQVGNQVVQRLIGADAGRGFGAAQTGLLIQRQWNFSQANSKAEFVRRTDEDNSLFLELVQLTKRTAGPYAVIDVDAVAHSAYATLGRAMRDAFPGAGIRPGTPIHGNEEGRLPVFGRRAYIELNYFGGGTRLVVDVIQSVVYISAHYRSFYILEDGGSAPTAVVQKAKKAYYDIEKAEPEEIRVPFEDTRGKNENVHANAG